MKIMATKQAEHEETAPRVAALGEKATNEGREKEEVKVKESFCSHGGSEIRAIPRAPAAASASVSDGGQSASDDTAEADADAEVSTDADAERTANKCVSCSSRKVKGCVNLACKRCCVRTDKDCAVHRKAPESKVKKAPDAVAVDVGLQPLRKSRKAVLKNEFKEANVLYYNETVTLFCLRDFFHAKKLSQPLLNDQTRRLRASGVATPRGERIESKETKTRRPGSEKAKADVMAALGDVSAKRRKVAATQ